MTLAKADTCRNGIDTAALAAIADVVAAHPDAGRFRLRAHGEWVDGSHSRSTIGDYFGAREERTHERTWAFDADHPALLAGRDNGPTPTEFVLHALASCLTAGLAAVAATRGVTLTEVRVTVEGDLDVRGTLGVDRSVRSGLEGVRIRLDVRGDAGAAALEDLVHEARRRSAVADVLTNEVPVTLQVTASATS